MAIYHLRATIISRSAGRSATAAAAYRSATHIADHRTGLAFDYRARSGVDHTEILAPAHAPDWVRDRAALWNSVEAAETRKNSQVAREIRVALPAELDLSQRAQLVRDFCQRQFVDRGMVADVALHAPGREGDERNHHAHILLTTREIGPEGFTTKNRDWNAVEVLEGWREAWAVESNAVFERLGVDERIDHRTLEAQRDEALELADTAQHRGDETEALQQIVRAVALDRPPLPQLSAGAWQLKGRGQDVPAVQAWREVKARAAEVARIAQELAGQVRSWLEHAADRVRDQLRFPGHDLIPASDGGRRELSQGFAARLREAWTSRQSHARDDVPSGAERDNLQGLAERLRAAAQGIDRDASADRADNLRQGREAEEAHKAREMERLRVEEVERKTHSHSRKGLDHGL